MKSSTLLPLVATLSLASCAQIASNLQQPITSDYNPLDGPSAPGKRNQSFQQTGPTFQPGEWVETAMPNSAFFYKIPRGNANADQILSKGSPLKVISTKGSYVKVELEGGTVGYVPTIMVAEPNISTDSAPFLPPPPNSPLKRSNDSMAPASLPDVAPSPLQSSGSSLIPPPSNYNGAAPSPLAPSASPERKATEILIPTTSTPSTPTPSPIQPSGGNLIPAPTGAGNAIDQAIGIE